MLIIGHRGASHDAPENTLAAFRLAWEQGADGIELDVHLTADGQVVVHHDEDTSRTGDRRLSLRKSTMSELRNVDAGAWMGERWKGERIPTLGDVLGETAREKAVFVEIKCGAEILDPLAEVMMSLGAAMPAVKLVGFDAETMSLAGETLPDLPVFWNVASAQVRTGVEPLIEDSVQRGFNGLGLAYCESLTPAAIRHVHDAGLECFVWCADDPEVARQLDACSVAYLATNRPALIRRALSG